SRQARLRSRHPGQVMQHPLVDSQRARGERRPGSYLDHPPAPERGTGGERAPMSPEERGESQTERGKGPLRIALEGGAERGKGSVELGAGRQEQQVALERRQAEERRQPVQRHRRAANRRAGAKTSLGGEPLSVR